MLLSRWDHTSVLAAGTYNLMCVVLNITSKSKAKPRPPSYFHPFRETSKSGVSIRPENFEDLRIIGNALCSN